MPTYSDLTITFLRDFEEDFTCTLFHNISNTSYSEQWTWVTTRSSGYEVTTGTPTGTAGETTAINYESAFDLDNLTGYVTTQTSNSVTISSENIDLVFIGFKAKDENENLLVNGVDFSLDYSNYVEPFDVSTLESVLTRSPHYVYTPFYFETTTKMDLGIKSYTGSFASPPSDNTYEMTKVRPTINYSQFNTNISDVINPDITNSIVIDATSTSQVLNTDLSEYVWINYIATFTDPIESVTPVEGYFGASYGYGNYGAGINPSLPNGVLTDCLRRKVSRDSYIMLPFKNNGYYTQVEITAGVDHNNTVVLTTSDLSNEFVQYVKILVSDITTASNIIVEFTKAAGGTDIVQYDIMDECENTPKTIFFINKYGFYDTLVMLAKNVQSLNVSKDSFVNNYVSDGAYDVTKHQMKDINVVGNESIRCNSGYINERQNELYKDLLLSDKVYLYNTDETVTPINVKTSNLTYKTRNNDVKVLYDIDFDYAYNTIQNV